MTGRRIAGRVVVVGGLLLVLAGCAPAGNEVVAGSVDQAGFWSGLWHGFILPITLVISLFREDVGIYEVSNNGGWYDVGFLLGAWAMLSGSARSRSVSRRRRRR